MPTREIPNPQSILETVQALAVRQLRYAPTASVARHWLDGLAAAEGALPGFDPLDAPSLLGYVYLLERQGDRLRYRVSGESVNMLFGSNHSGKYLDEVVPAGLYPFVIRFFLDVFDLKACFFKGHVTLSNQRLTEFERLLLPVRRGGEIQILGTLALSTSSPLREDVPLPPRADQGFHFSQIDLATLAVTETSYPLDQLPVETMPFDRHYRSKVNIAS